MQSETCVLNIGGGPVGLAAAIELSWRGVPMILVNDKPETTRYPKCNNTNARSTEHFRQFGIAYEIRAGQLPPQLPRASAYVTRFCGYEFGRMNRPWSNWPTPELPCNLSQMALEKIQRGGAERVNPDNIHFGWWLDSFRVEDCRVRASIVSTAGERHETTARYLFGIDRAASFVRHALGFDMRGEDGSGHSVGRAL